MPPSTRDPSRGTAQDDSARRAGCLKISTVFLRRDRARIAHADLRFDRRLVGVSEMLHQPLDGHAASRGERRVEMILPVARCPAAVEGVGILLAALPSARK